MSLRGALVGLAGLAMVGCNVAGAPGRPPASRAAFLDDSSLGRPVGGLLYGTAIGAWPMQAGRYDGHPMLDYNGSCPECPELARAAQVAVVRWGIWNAFEGMPIPVGQTAPPLRRAEFDSVIDGIRDRLDAAPLINLPPGGTSPPGLLCPDAYGMSNLIKLDQEIIQQAGQRVQLYEIANEPELGCDFPRDPVAAGASAAHLWVALAPPLRKTARALGLQIYLGGPAFTTTHVNPRDDDLADARMIQAYVQGIRDAYENPAGPSYHDPDLIPSFISFHAYGTEYLANGGARPVDAIPHYAAYLLKVRATLDEVWGPTIGPRIRIACTEWNYAADDSVDWASPLVPAYYTQFLNMLRERGVWLAIQFLVGSNGNGMDMITLNGRPTAYYEAFKAASLASRASN